MREIKKMLTPENHNEGTIDRIKYIVIHYVGAEGSAKANCNYFMTYRGSSAHYFIDHNGDIYQSVEDKDVAWHCGAKTYKHPECRNANSIGVELCCRNKNGWYFEDVTVESAIELTKYLMDKYHIDADHVIRHYDVTGKDCPNPFVKNPAKWEAFREAIGKVNDGWVHTNVWKYYKDGKAVTGWNLINHHWYYMNPIGEMLTGWQLIDNRWCYLEESGDYEGAMWKSDEDGWQNRWYIE